MPTGNNREYKRKYAKEASTVGTPSRYDRDARIKAHAKNSRQGGVYGWLEQDSAKAEARAANRAHWPKAEKG